MNANKTLRACTLLAQAYAFAKSGNVKAAGKLLVQAAEDDGLDEVMDGVAQAADSLDDDTADDDSDFEEVDDTEEEDDEDAATVTANVDLPDSVARLAARALV